MSESIESETNKYLLFTAGDENYILESSQIKEICRNQEFFYLPFLPDYMKGVMNYYGTPYSVVDLCKMFGGPGISSGVFMILSTEEEIALHVSAIHDFHGEEEFSKGFTPAPDENGLYKGSFMVNGEIPSLVVNIKKVLEKIQQDLES